MIEELLASLQARLPELALKGAPPPNLVTELSSVGQQLGQQAITPQGLPGVTPGLPPAEQSVGAALTPNFPGAGIAPDPGMLVPPGGELGGIAPGLGGLGEADVGAGLPVVGDFAGAVPLDAAAAGPDIGAMLAAAGVANKLIGGARDENRPPAPRAPGVSLSGLGNAGKAQAQTVASVPGTAIPSLGDLLRGRR